MTRDSILPEIDAVLNGLSAALLVAGYVCVRRRRLVAHKTCMILALGVSSAFLVCYLTYHATHGSKAFEGQGWIRPVYFAILISHTTLAAIVVPLALVTAWRGLRGRLEKHKRIARITLPVWNYVSVTGVVVYCMLYRLFP